MSFVPSFDFEPPPIIEDNESEVEFANFSKAADADWGDFGSFAQSAPSPTKGDTTNWGRFTPPPLSPNQENDAISIEQSKKATGVTDSIDYSAQLIDSVKQDIEGKENSGDNEEPVFGLFYKDDTHSTASIDNDSEFTDFTNFENVYFQNDVIQQSSGIDDSWAAEKSVLPNPGNHPEAAKYDQHNEVDIRGENVDQNVKISAGAENINGKDEIHDKVNDNVVSFEEVTTCTSKKNCTNEIIDKDFNTISGAKWDDGTSITSKNETHDFGSFDTLSEKSNNEFENVSIPSVNTDNPIGFANTNIQSGDFGSFETIENQTDDFGMFSNAESQEVMDSQETHANDNKGQFDGSDGFGAFSNNDDQSAVQIKFHNAEIENDEKGNKKEDSAKEADAEIYFALKLKEGLSDDILTLDGTNETKRVVPSASLESFDVTIKTESDAAIDPAETLDITDNFVKETVGSKSEDFETLQIDESKDFAEFETNTDNVVGLDSTEEIENPDTSCNNDFGTFENNEKSNSDVRAFENDEVNTDFGDFDTGVEKNETEANCDNDVRTFENTDIKVFENNGNDVNDFSTFDTAEKINDFGTFENGNVDVGAFENNENSTSDFGVFDTGNEIKETETSCDNDFGTFENSENSNADVTTFETDKNNSSNLGTFVAAVKISEAETSCDNDFGTFENSENSNAEEINTGDFGTFDNAVKISETETSCDNDFGTFENSENSNAEEINTGDFGTFDNAVKISETETSCDNDFGTFENSENSNVEEMNTGDFGTFDNGDKISETETSCDNDFETFENSENSNAEEINTGDFGAFDNAVKISETETSCDNDFGTFENSENSNVEEMKTGDYGAFDNGDKINETKTSCDNGFGTFENFENNDDNYFGSFENGNNDDFGTFEDSKNKDIPEKSGTIEMDDKVKNANLETFENNENSTDNFGAFDGADPAKISDFGSFGDSEMVQGDFRTFESSGGKTDDFGAFGDVTSEPEQFNAFGHTNEFGSFNNTGKNNDGDESSEINFASFQSDTTNDFSEFKFDGSNWNSSSSNAPKEKQDELGTSNTLASEDKRTNTAGKSSSALFSKCTNVMLHCNPPINDADLNPKRIYELSGYLNNTCQAEESTPLWEEITVQYDEEKWMKIFYTSDHFRSQIPSFGISYEAQLKMEKGTSQDFDVKNQNHPSLTNVASLSPAGSISSLDIESQFNLLMPEPAQPSKNTLLAQSQTKDKSHVTVFQSKGNDSEPTSETASLDLDYFASTSSVNQEVQPASANVNLYDIDLSSLTMDEDRFTDAVKSSFKLEENSETLEQKKVDQHEFESADMSDNPSFTSSTNTNQDSDINLRINSSNNFNDNQFSDITLKGSNDTDNDVTNIDFAGFEGNMNLDANPTNNKFSAFDSIANSDGSVLNSQFSAFESTSNIDTNCTDKEFSVFESTTKVDAIAANDTKYSNDEFSEIESTSNINTTATNNKFSAFDNTSKVHDIATNDISALKSMSNADAMNGTKDEFSTFDNTAKDTIASNRGFSIFGSASNTDTEAMNDEFSAFESTAKVDAITTNDNFSAFETTANVNSKATDNDFSVFETTANVNTKAADIEFSAFETTANVNMKAADNDFSAFETTANVNTKAADNDFSTLETTAIANTKATGNEFSALGITANVYTKTTDSDFSAFETTANVNTKATDNDFSAFESITNVNIKATDNEFSAFETTADVNTGATDNEFSAFESITNINTKATDSDFSVFETTANVNTKSTENDFSIFETTANANTKATGNDFSAFETTININTKATDNDFSAFETTTNVNTKAADNEFSAFETTANVNSKATDNKFSAFESTTTFNSNPTDDAFTAFEDTINLQDTKVTDDAFSTFKITSNKDANITNNQFSLLENTTNVDPNANVTNNKFPSFENTKIMNTNMANNEFSAFESTTSSNANTINNEFAAFENSPNLDNNASVESNEFSGKHNWDLSTSSNITMDTNIGTRNSDFSSFNMSQDTNTLPVNPGETTEMNNSFGDFATFTSDTSNSSVPSTNIMPSIQPTTVHKETLQSNLFGNLKSPSIVPQQSSTSDNDKYSIFRQISTDTESEFSVKSMGEEITSQKQKDFDRVSVTSSECSSNLNFPSTNPNTVLPNDDFGSFNQNTVGTTSQLPSNQQDFGGFDTAFAASKLPNDTVSGFGNFDTANKPSNTVSGDFADFASFSSPVSTATPEHSEFANFSSFAEPANSSTHLYSTDATLTLPSLNNDHKEHFSDTSKNSSTSQPIASVASNTALSDPGGASMDYSAFSQQQAQADNSGFSSFSSAKDTVSFPKQTNLPAPAKQSEPNQMQEFGNFGSFTISQSNINQIPSQNIDMFGSNSKDSQNKTQFNSSDFGDFTSTQQSNAQGHSSFPSHSGFGEFSSTNETPQQFNFPNVGPVNTSPFQSQQQVNNFPQSSNFTHQSQSQMPTPVPQSSNNQDMFSLQQMNFNNTNINAQFNSNIQNQRFPQHQQFVARNQFHGNAPQGNMVQQGFYRTPQSGFRQNLPNTRHPVQNKPKYLSSSGNDPFAGFTLKNNASQLHLKSAKPLQQTKKSLNDMAKK